MMGLLWRLQTLLVLLIFSATDIVEPRNMTCIDGSIPCGPGRSCCPSGDVCNFKRGIPQCEDLSQSGIVNFGGLPCDDPYLYQCDIPGMDGICCPIGTVCLHYDAWNYMVCIDALGVTATGAFPSTTTGFVPSSTPVANTNNAGLHFSPEQAWNKMADSPSCAISSTIWTTSTINASISFNYTGPSIMVHVVTSSHGGLFSILLDGMNTTSLIDTYADEQHVLPQCFPNQYPPFLMIPPTYHNDSETMHTITLVYIGASPNAPNGANDTHVQFDSFAIPVFMTDAAQNNGSGGASKGNIGLAIALVWMVCIIVESLL